MGERQGPPTTSPNGASGDHSVVERGDLTTCSDEPALRAGLSEHQVVGLWGLDRLGLGLSNCSVEGRGDVGGGG
eukprot:2388418-Rhodomonas_salina.1